MSPEALKSATKELKRLKKMPQQMPEHAMIRFNKLMRHLKLILLMMMNFFPIHQLLPPSYQTEINLLRVKVTSSLQELFGVDGRTALV